jgi:hypothetical protein
MLVEAAQTLILRGFRAAGIKIRRDLNQRNNGMIRGCDARA